MSKLLPDTTPTPVHPLPTTTISPGPVLPMPPVLPSQGIGTPEYTEQGYPVHVTPTGMPTCDAWDVTTQECLVDVPPQTELAESGGVMVPWGLPVGSVLALAVGLALLVRAMRKGERA